MHLISVSSLRTSYVSPLAGAEPGGTVGQDHLAWEQSQPGPEEHEQPVDSTQLGHPSPLTSLVEDLETHPPPPETDSQATGTRSHPTHRHNLEIRFHISTKIL